jgi:hypothetical protein
MQLFLFVLVISLPSWSKPYFLPEKVSGPQIQSNLKSNLLSQREFTQGSKVLRLEVDWKSDETYTLNGMYLENSGTPALIKKSQKKDLFGSYKAELYLKTSSDENIFHSSVGTGKEFRKLIRTLSFRFPFPQDVSEARLMVTAEHPLNGLPTKIIDQKLDLGLIRDIPTEKVIVTLLKKAVKTPVLYFNFYAEGFDENGENKFIKAAQKAILILDQNLPGSEHFEYRAVFAPSSMKLGPAKDLGPEVKTRESFLGLYFPYWRKFGRWYHVVYPTSERKYRDALAQAPYDYPLALVDDGGYWGVGNYKELTAIPIGSSQFSYLLLHEFGHFMGLNEEYEGGGPTELEFAPNIPEPWSQNITFNPKNLKWGKLTEPGISIPTTSTDYHRYGGALKNPVGAYLGGYADSEPTGRSHKPVRTCMMSSGGDFCKVCQKALKELVETDAGLE